MHLGVSIKAYCNSLQGLFLGENVLRPLPSYYSSSQSILINDRLW